MHLALYRPAVVDQGINMSVASCFDVFYLSGQPENNSRSTSGYVGHVVDSDGAAPLLAICGEDHRLSTRKSTESSVCPSGGPVSVCVLSAPPSAGCDDGKRAVINGVLKYQDWGSWIATSYSWEKEYSPDDARHLATSLSSNCHTNPISVAN